MSAAYALLGLSVGGVGVLLLGSAYLERRAGVPGRHWSVNAMCGAIVLVGAIVLFLSEARVS